MFTVHFVRHGEVSNPQQILYARLPRFQLSEAGKLQAKNVAEALSRQPLAAVFSSPLLRARQTAELVAAPHSLSIHISTLLNEVLTPYEGWPVSEFSKVHDIYDGIPEGYEQPQDLVRRVRRFIRRVSREFADRHIVAVTHGDIILSVRLWAENVPWASEQNITPVPYPALGSMTSILFDSDERAVGSTYCEPGQDSP
jgi:broad specificity phosphatase PhoE